MPALSIVVPAGACVPAGYGQQYCYVNCKMNAIADPEWFSVIGQRGEEMDGLIKEMLLLIGKLIWNEQQIGAEAVMGVQII
jgi:hypothetical protein